MSEPKHSNVLLGKSIREIRLRRGLTQREVSEAIGGISESALRSYELGERYDELVHALFLLEDRFGIEPCADGSIRFTDEAIQSCVCTWRDWKEFLEKGKITREEYENRKDSFLR